MWKTHAAVLQRRLGVLSLLSATVQVKQPPPSQLFSRRAGLCWRLPWRFCPQFSEAVATAERTITVVPGISTITHLLQPPLQACFSFPRHRLSLPGRRPVETDRHEVWLRRQYVPARLPDECSLLGTPDKNQWGARFLTIYFWAGPKQASLRIVS